MGNFIIEPQTPQFPTVWDNTFLWEENNIYVMANHRLALWCWLQCKGILRKKHALIHIDKHTDARMWKGPGEQECLKQAVSIISKLKDMGTYESLQCPCQGAATNRATRPCITYDNFVYLATEVRLFNHYYIYSSAGDWCTNLPKTAYNYCAKIEDVYNLAKDIKKYSGKCIVDIDLDFFDLDDLIKIPKGVTEDSLLFQIFNIIAEHKDKITTITISINESPGDSLWEKRQHQLSIIRKLLKMNMPIPIINI